MKYMQKYDDELRNLIKDNPKCFLNLIKSKGKKDKTKDKSYLLNYIMSCTKALDSNIYTLKTRIYWVLNHIESFDDKRVRCQNPKCKTKNGTPLIGKNVKKLNEGYVKTCCKQCERDIAQATTEERLMKKYGVKNSFQLDYVKEKLADKKEESMLKSQTTKITRYNDPFYNNSKQATETKIETYGSVWNITKIHETKDKLHGNPNWNNPLKNFNTKKLHNTFNESNDEKLLRLLCGMLFGDDVKFLYKSDKYPFACDFYINSIDTYVEYNGLWTHGNHPFDASAAEDIELVNKWKSKNTKFYDNAICTWTERDVKKRNTAKLNNLNFKEFWSFDDITLYFFSLKDDDKLYVWPNAKRLKSDKAFFDDALLQAKPIPFLNMHNYIVKYFQQDMFYIEENKKWKDLNIREKLIVNRCKYLNKTLEELTDLDLLDGFKVSGIHYGYSHFNPLLFKWFILNYDMKRCYDPCGGWGHRLLATKDLELYIYNDKSTTVKANVDRMIKYFNLKNIVTYNNDAINFIPTENFDSMFTCPPYFNVEHYECGDFKDMNEYKQLIDSLFDTFNNKTSCKIFGLVTREDMLFSHTDYIEKFEIMPEKSGYLNSKNKKQKEYLYVYKKRK